MSVASGSVCARGCVSVRGVGVRGVGVLAMVASPVSTSCVRGLGCCFDAQRASEVFQTHVKLNKSDFLGNVRTKNVQRLFQCRQFSFLAGLRSGSERGCRGVQLRA